MSNPKPARYRTTNWSNYNAALRKRGSLLVWLDQIPEDEDIGTAEIVRVV